MSRKADQLYKYGQSPTTTLDATESLKMSGMIWRTRIKEYCLKYLFEEGLSKCKTVQDMLLEEVGCGRI